MKGTGFKSLREIWVLYQGTTKEAAEKLDILVEPSVPDRKC
jgi:hypothetical protein